MDAVRLLLAAGADLSSAADLRDSSTGPLYNCYDVTPLHLAVADSVFSPGLDLPAVVKLLVPTRRSA